MANTNDEQRMANTNDEQRMANTNDEQRMANTNDEQRIRGSLAQDGVSVKQAGRKAKKKRRFYDLGHRRNSDSGAK
jgi:hypothetical protein